MDKDGILPTARLSAVPISGWESGAAEPADTALSLLRAVAFRITDGAHLHLSPSAQACELLNLSRARLPQSVRDWTDRLSPEDRRTRKKALRRLGWDGAQYRVQYAWRTEQGETLQIEEHGRRLSGLDAHPTDIEGVFRDVSVAHRAQTRAAWLAQHDGLTGLPNPKALTQALAHMTALSARHRGHSSFLRLRVTNIADLNAVYGYETGDQLLTEIARRLEQVVRAPDVLGRIGGADFGICLYGADETAVNAMAERLRFLIENAPVQTPHGGLYAELTFAATSTRAYATDARAAMDQTAIAIVQSGTGPVAHYSAAMGLNDVKPKTGVTADDILDALNQRQVRLAYQPIIETASRQLHHYECLLRLRRVDGEIVSAGQLIMAAERLGLVHLLDRRALDIASQTLLDDPNVHLALNVSAGTVKDRVAAESYLAALRALGPAASRVTLELTETVALDDPATASAFSDDVRAIGCGFAIDDFGSGYTTFRNLMAIEADMIKIDGTLIEGIATDANKQTFVRMMVDLAQTFSVKTVAEMVDDRADAEILRRLGVDYLQGFMFGVPSAAPAWQRRAG